MESDLIVWVGRKSGFKGEGYHLPLDWIIDGQGN